MLTVRQDDFTPATGDPIDASTVGVARIAADVLAESSVGFVATFGDPASNRGNSLVGADFLYQNTRFPGGRTLEAEGWLQQSHTPGATGGESAFGFGGRLIDSDGWRYGASYKQMGRSFRPALGFVSRTGVRDFGITFGALDSCCRIVVAEMMQAVVPPGHGCERPGDVRTCIHGSLGKVAMSPGHG